MKSSKEINRVDASSYGKLLRIKNEETEKNIASGIFGTFETFVTFLIFFFFIVVIQV